MKTNAPLAFFFFLALFAFTRADVVLDSHGLPVERAGKYFLLPTALGGEAIVGAATGESGEHRSLAVVKELSNDKGWSTKISPENPFEPVITTDHPVEITFDPLPSNPCTDYPHWHVEEDKDFGQSAVLVGHPGAIHGSFYFKPYDFDKHHYSLDFCFGSLHDQCEHVSIKTDPHGKKRLIVTNDEQVEPFVFKLVLKSIFVASDISMVV